MRQSLPLLLVALLAAGAVGHATSGRTDPAPSAPPPPEQAGKVDRCPGPRATVEAFLKTRSVEPGAAPRPRDGKRFPESQDKVETLIATVPDPLASGLDYQFDLAVSAIQLAAGAVQYSLATSWLPWRASADGEGAARGVACARAEPGALIFRTRRFVLLVFLVGETPTAGVHPGALDQAIALAERFQQGGPDGARRTLRILGPTYSGSALSLARVLDRHEGVSVRILSGSASREDVDDILGRVPATAGLVVVPAAVSSGAPADGAAAAPLPRFQRTIQTHEALRRVAERHLGELGIGLDRIAYLVESSTTFGVEAVWRGPRVVAGKRQPPEARWRDIAFPLHVSNVRRALDRGRPRSGAVQIAGYELSQTLLGLQEDRGSALGDLVPVYSDASSNYDEMALAGEISSACQARTRAFGIEATDARDKRFLIERIRALCPGALVFTFEGDLLFAYPDEQSRLSGTLIFSTYPLFHLEYESRRAPDGAAGPELANRASPNPPLGDSASTGIYNAAIVHLAEIYARHSDLVSQNAELRELVDYRCPFPPDGPRAADEAPGRHPPVWISVASRNAILPMGAACVDPGASMYRDVSPERAAPRATGAGPGAAPRAPPGEVRPRPVKPTRAVWILTLALAAYCVVLSLRWWPPNAPSQRAWATLHLGFSTLMLLVFVVLTASPRGGASHDAVTRTLAVPLRFGTRAAVGFGLLATTAALVALIRPVTAHLYPPRRGRRRAAYWSAVAAAAGIAGLAVERFAGALHAALTSGPPSYFTATRAMHLLTGASPLLPLLMLALAVHILIALRLSQEVLLEARFGAHGALAGLLGGSSPSVAWAEDQLEWIVRSRWRRPLVNAAVLAVLAVAVVILPWSPTPEGRWFDTPFRLGFAVVAIAVSLCWARAVLAWLGLRTILRRVSRHPLRQALQALPRLALPGRFGNLLSMRPTVRELEVSEAILARCARTPSGSDRRRLALVEAEIRQLAIGPVGDRRQPWRTGAFGIHQRIAEDLAAGLAAGDRWSATRLLDEAAAPSAEEMFVARQLTLGVAWAVAHIRELLSATVAGAVLTAMAVGVYPFPATRVLMVAVWVLLLAAAVTAIWIVYSFERTEVAAWMAGAPPGQVIDWRLAANVLGVSVLPILLVVAVQFPDAASWLARVLDPFLATIK